MIDATVGFTEQDSKVAGYAHEQGKACIIAVNKWDAVEKDSYTMDAMRKKLEEDFSFMSYAPIVFISAKTGQRVDKLFETIHFVDVQNGTRVPTGALNEMLARATAKVQPPSDKGKRLKVFYVTQPADVRLLRQPESAVPFLVPALSGKPDPRDVRPDRHPHQDDYPRARRRRGQGRKGVTHGEKYPSGLRADRSRRLPAGQYPVRRADF